MKHLPRMKVFSFLLSLSFFSTTVLADTYPEVIFDNSLVKGAYAKSRVHYSGNSWVENSNKQLLVSDTLFFTPGNALSLKYQSAAHGNWQVDLRYSRQKLNYRLNQEDFLVLKLYVKSAHTAKKHLPLLKIQQRFSETTVLKLADFVEDLQGKQWMSIRIPLSKFKNLQLQNPISALTLMQSGDSDDIQHELFLDQIEFIPKNHPTSKLSSTAILSKAVAYDRQVNLQWQMPLTPSIRYVKIYRSEDNKLFSPVAIRPIFMQSALDDVPALDKSYYYKIAWLDYNYNESPFSAVQEVKTSALSKDKLLDVVQAAHVNYFVENYDINSGMYMPFGLQEQATVSVKETGHAILALIVGAEKGFVNRQMVLNRISKTVYFLLRAQNRYGVFPPYFDGRTGIPDYRKQVAHYDVVATSSLLEALLVAKQYFSGDNDSERDFRNRITKLYDNVAWQSLSTDSTHSVLVERVLAIDDSIAQHTLGGLNEGLSAYMLAMASTKSPLSTTAFHDGALQQEVTYVPAVDTVAQDSLLTPWLPLASAEGMLFAPALDTIAVPQLPIVKRATIAQDTIMYGVNLPFGAYSGNMVELYRPFLTIDPERIKWNKQDFAQILRKYISVRKRGDNETAMGAVDADIWGYYEARDLDHNLRINPAIAPASIFVLQEEGERALLSLYQSYGDTFFTEYGFRAWLDLQNNDVSDEYFAINQATIAVMIENARSGLIWRLYQEIPEIKALQQKLFNKVEIN